MAGGVWWLEEWQDWLDNPEIGPVAFQFGTRPILTKESPISDAWKKRLDPEERRRIPQRFSPTGFYSRADRNKFMKELRSPPRTPRVFPTSESAIIAAFPASARTEGVLADAA